MLYLMGGRVYQFGARVQCGRYVRMNGDCHFKELRACLYDAFSGYYLCFEGTQEERLRVSVQWVLCDAMIRQAGLMRLSITLPEPCFAITKAGMISN